jgi:hypothetical protein
MGSDYYGLFSNFITYFENVQINNPAPVSGIYGDNISLQARGITIQNNLGIATQGGGISCINCKKVDIDSSTFINLNA